MSFWSKIKKLFRWLPFLWKVDDGSYISLYMVIAQQLMDMQLEIGKFSDIYIKGIEYLEQIQEALLSCGMIIAEDTDSETIEKAKNRVLAILKEYSTEWWI